MELIDDGEYEKLAEIVYEICTYFPATTENKPLNARI
jgi:hypothetical protein